MYNLIRDQLNRKETKTNVLAANYEEYYIKLLIPMNE